MRYSIAMATVVASTVQTLENVDTELKSMIEPLWARVLALVGEFFAPGGLAGGVPGV
jgi:hypothetical protein